MFFRSAGISPVYVVRMDGNFLPLIYQNKFLHLLKNVGKAYLPMNRHHLSVKVSAFISIKYWISVYLSRQLLLTR